MGSSPRHAGSRTGSPEPASTTVDVVPTGGRPLVFAQCLRAPEMRPPFSTMATTICSRRIPWISRRRHLAMRQCARTDFMLVGPGTTGSAVSPSSGRRDDVEARGRIPVNLEVLIEGEEESGSPNLESAVARLKERLACDIVVSANGAIWRVDLPITVASRGRSTWCCAAHPRCDSAGPVQRRRLFQFRRRRLPRPGAFRRGTAGGLARYLSGTIVIASSV